MSVDLDPQEVLQHLHSLGYYNVTKEQLKDFIKDLKKLIKYDLQKEERKYHFPQHTLKTANKENLCINETSLTSKKNFGSPVKDVPNVSQEKSSHHHECFSHDDSSEKYSSKNTSSKREQFPEKGSTSGTLPNCKSACPNCHQPLDSGQTCSKMYSSKSESDSGSTFEGCIHTVCDTQVKSGVKTKKQPINPKPCPSFIRPVNKVKPAKADPVALYHYYKTLWSQFTLPGENSHEDLRWRIRHRMMAPRMPTKAPNDEKINKRPDWVSS